MNRPYIRPEVREQVRRKKLKRPYIKEKIVLEVILRDIEEKKEGITRQKELLFELQRQAFLQQQTKNVMEMMLDEELEEDQGMSL